MKRPTPDPALDAALWSRVASTVRPIAGKVRPAPPPPGLRLPEKAPDAPSAPRRSTLADRQPVDTATLDGTWDKRMVRGRLRPDRTIDLHGYTGNHAERVLRAAIDDAALSGDRVLLVITGKGVRAGQEHDDDRPRGVIRASLPRWLESAELRPWIAALRPAHPRHGGGGAWYVILRRR